MTYGENPYKVANIVKGQFDEFSQIYLPLLREVSPTSTAASSSASSLIHVTTRQKQYKH